MRAGHDLSQIERHSRQARLPTSSSAVGGRVVASSSVQPCSTSPPRRDLAGPRARPHHLVGARDHVGVLRRRAPLGPGATDFGALAIAVEAGFFPGACFAWRRNLWLVIGIHAGWNSTESVLRIAVSGEPPTTSSRCKRLAASC